VRSSTESGEPVLSLFRETLRREMLSAARIVIDETDPESGRVDAENWHVRYQYPFFLLAHLYRNDFTGNVHYGKPEVLDLAVHMAKCMMSTRSAQGLYEGGSVGGGDFGYLEWPVYYLCRFAQVLGDALDEADRREVVGAVAQYVEAVLPKPWGFTAPNHDAWRCLDVLLAAEVCDRPTWADAAWFHIHRLIAFQRDAGFWEESRHHGPSVGYNYTMQMPLYTFYRVSGDEEVRAACERLIAFMTTVCLPDGTNIGAFDGRQGYHIGVPLAALQLTPKGRRLLRLLLDARALLNAAEATDAHYSGSNWNSHHRFAASADDDLLMLDDPGEEVPLDAEGYYRYERHRQAFEASVHRVGAWFAAAGGNVSDIPLHTHTSTSVRPAPTTPACRFTSPPRRWA